MKKLLLMKTVFLLCALVAGSSNLWADTVTFDATKDVDADASSYQTSEKTYTATDGSTWKANGYGATKKTNLVIGKGGANYLLTPNVSGTISSVAVTWSGNTSYYLALQTADGKTELEAKSNPSSSSTETFSVSGTYSQLRLVGRRSSGTSNAAATITKVVVTYTPSGGPTTYSVVYDGNGATSGSAPIDATAYSSGASVTVKGNTDGLAIPSFTFGGWNTKADGTGTNYSADDTFTISANTTLYAQWNFAVTDGIFDFINAAKQEPLEDYGSGMTLSTSYTTSDKTWTAGNVKMVTSRVSGNGYRWYTDNTLRFYDKSKATFSVPTGYIITKIVTTGANFNSSSPSGLSGSTWTGASNTVELIATAGKNINTITVTYIPTPGPADPTISGDETYLTTSDNMAGWRAFYDASNSYSVDGNTKVYVADADPVGTKIKLKAIEGIPANVPVILHTSSSADNYKMTLTKETASPFEYDGTNKLIWATTAQTNVYRLGFGASGVGFYPYSGTPASGAVILNVSSAASARELTIGFDDETTGLKAISNEPISNSQVFDLQGRIVINPTKGLYIVNGKKVVIK